MCLLIVKLLISISFSNFLCLRKFKGKALFAKYDADLRRVSESTLKADSSPWCKM